MHHKIVPSPSDRGAVSEFTLACWIPLLCDFCSRDANNGYNTPASRQVHAESTRCQIVNTLVAGATALLAAVNTEVREMGWYYLPVILLTSTLALVVALLIDNIQRRYPTFWFQPNPPPPPVTKAPVDTPPTSTAASMLEEKPRDTANTFPV